VATQTQDDGFREIQLNGKQLVFVFMAATVVSVVIFLCGVLVGRGVRSERETTQAAAAVEPIVPDLTAAQVPPTSKEEVADLTKAAPPSPPQGDAERGGADLVKPAATEGRSDAAAVPPPAEPAARTPAAKAPAASPEPAPAAKAEAPRTAAAPAAPAKAPTPAAKSPSASDVTGREARKAEPARSESAKADAAKSGPARADARPSAGGIPAVDDPKRGWVIQVAAVKTRDEAEGLAKELGSKGYSAFILSGNSNVFRVRVGGYKSKRDAETVAAKLRREERINPWVTR